MNLKQIGTIGIACFISAIAAVGIYSAFGGKKTVFLDAESRPSSFQTASYSDSETTAQVPFDFTLAAKKGLPAVVHIRSTIQRMEAQRAPRSVFDDFFGIPMDRQGQPQRGVGFGSGVIISSDGYIVTNNHVIEDANEIEVILYDNESIEAELVGTDPTTDIALLKIKKSGLDFLKFADSDQIQIGEWVSAIGNPAVGQDAYTLKSTVTAGIVSAIGRNIGINQEDYKIESFIQTDAVINRGNSGGALVNVNGDLVGINTAISTPTGVYAGYGFAVPANLVKKVVTDIKDYGKVQRALLGVRYGDIESELSKGATLEDLGTKEKEGLLIDSVEPGSAAEKAGLKSGDVIIEVDGVDVTNDSTSHLQEIIGRKHPGDVVKLVYKRDGNKKTTSAKLMSAEDTAKNYDVARNVTDFKDLGIQVEDLTKSEKAKLDLTNGVRVKDSDQEGMMYQESYGDIAPGFIITKVNNKAVDSVTEFKNALRSTNTNVIRIEGIKQNEPNSSYIYQFRKPVNN